MGDKLKHFLACILITWIVLLVFHLFYPLGYNWDAGIATVVAILIAGAKEIVWDKWLRKGQPDYYDFFWGVCGAVLGPVLWMVGELIINAIKY